MAVGVSKSNNFYGRNDELLFTETGNKENNFSANTEGGVKLWESKQLFLSIKNLTVLREGLPEILEPLETECYLILTNHDYYGKDATFGIRYLALYVNSENYHIYLPKDYYEPNKLQNHPTVYLEYEPNEITRRLIDDIIQ